MGIILTLQVVQVPIKKCYGFLNMSCLDLRSCGVVAYLLLLGYPEADKRRIGDRANLSLVA